MRGQTLLDVHLDRGAALAIGKGVIGGLDELGRYAALAAGQLDDVIDVVKLAAPGLGALSLDARRLEQKNGHACCCQLLPARQQLVVGVARWLAAAQQELKLSGAVVDVAQQAAHGTAPRPVAQPFADFWPLGLGQMEVRVQQDEALAVFAGGGRVDGGDGAGAIAWGTRSEGVITGVGRNGEFS